ncbi:MAG: DUF4405 domain-containing protein [Methanomicrobiales archaeon]|nr:DUF4405 domain-containing protein [Methanomicrobiales archaeon]
MRKAFANALVDIAALVAFIPSLVSGLVLYLALPEGGGYRGGAGSGFAQAYLGLTRGDWRAIHDYTSLVFAALIVIHLLLHVQYLRKIGRSPGKGDTTRDDAGTLPR